MQLVFSMSFHMGGKCQTRKNNLKKHIKKFEYLQKLKSKYQNEDDYDRTSPDIGNASLIFLGGGMFV